MGIGVGKPVDFDIVPNQAFANAAAGDAGAAAPPVIWGALQLPLDLVVKRNIFNRIPPNRT